MKVVSNASPIILLSNVGKLNILRDLYKRIVIPGAVNKEVFEVRKKAERPDWIKVEDISADKAVKFLMNSLGPGESEAIALSVESKADLLLLDDYHARRYADSIGLEITGVAGIILDAKSKGMIKSVKEILDALVESDYRISESLYNDIWGYPVD